LPASHSLQLSALSDPSVVLNDPGSQPVHAVAPAPLYLPAPHSVQAVVLVAALPASHIWQLSALVEATTVLVDPAAQPRQAAVLLVLLYLCVDVV
jgi:hypothetical protein